MRHHGTRVEVVPHIVFGEIDLTLTRLVCINRVDHDRGSEHKLVGDVLHRLVLGEVHDKRTHDGVVLEMHVGCEGVDVRHHTIAQLETGLDGLVGRMTLGSYIPWLAEGELSVGAIHRHPCAELMPAHVKLAPFLEVGILAACLVKQLLRLLVTFLDREASDVLAPERHAGDGEVQSGGNLGLQVLPPCADVARPCRRRIALLGGETVARQKEDAAVVGREAVAVAVGVPRRVCLQPRRRRCGLALTAGILDGGVVGALAVIYRLGVDNGIGVEELVRRTVLRRSAQQLAICHVRTVADIGLGGVHPPGVHAYRAQLLVQLAPEYLARSLVVGVIEGIAVAQPVVERIPDRLLVDHTLGVQLLEVVNGEIVFRPARNHYLGVHGMDVVYHLLRRREARGVERECAPLVGRPVVPVHHYVVDGQLALTEAFQRTDNLVLRLVALAALPVAQQPLGHNLRLARQLTVALDDFVGVATGYDIIVKLLRHLAPPRLFRLLITRDGGIGAQAAVCLAAIRNPFETESVAATLLHVDRKLARIGIPGGAPDGLRVTATARNILGIDALAVDEDALIAGIIMAEMIIAGGKRLDSALVGHMRAIETEVRKILRRLQVLEVERILTAHYCLLHVVVVLARQRTGIAVAVVETEDTVELIIVAGIAETAQRIAVEQQAVALVGHHERYADLSVVLEQFLVLAFIVPFVCLMLPQAVESLVRRRFKHLADAPATVRLRTAVGMGLNGRIRSERLPPTLLLLQEDLAGEVGESHLARLPVNTGTHTLRRHHDTAAVLADIKRGFRLAGNHDKALGIGKLVCSGGGDTNYLVAYDLKTDKPGTPRLVFRQLHDYTSPGGCETACRYRRHRSKEKQ